MRSGQIRMAIYIGETLLNLIANEPYWITLRKDYRDEKGIIAYVNELFTHKHVICIPFEEDKWWIKG